MNDALLDADEHVLSTLDKDGTRRWLYPRVSLGRFWHARRIVGYLLIALFVALPHIRINGRPAILLNITGREFTLFGLTFLPTDTLLLALFMVSLFLTIFLLTAILGRVWCGWACPQTVYLEFVYRPIERLLMLTKGRGGVPGKNISGWRYIALYAIYLVLSMLLAHTFLAYFVGVEKLSQWIRLSPIEHPGPFLVMLVTTVMMMFDFSFFREQLCVIACPYGRFQSVLLDRSSLIVAYDRTRGEPRGKVKKSLPIVNQHLGDCVDCGLCVRTCPTGIDIRDGLQMECIHCTQCMDACDAVMEKVKRPKGLIRYSSQNAMDGESQRFLRPRVVIYPTLILILVSLLTYNIVTRKSFDVTLMRNLGSPFIMTESGEVENSLRIKLVNRLDKKDQFKINVLSPQVVQIDRTQPVVLESGATETVGVLVTIPKNIFTYGQVTADLEIVSQSGDRRVVQCKLLGP
ncbi:cytochrome c oxidase accessory protein CcoG [Rubinisphaera sp.]|uniref:cytochrome c oxidase accessory protein CcoG n=1 Tax=Rubinisphaera sp. TaxID=2024857 RepID=UPI000C11D571|nr:cytochrome c oxidase accessory protein CcoG [Rubinisphaera sp.]MBV12165.1 cytochrome c oxidase accessory protein CcoG [Rubinisphaera sp.]HCS54309.1 cytochrome c oxidase accessory protein CcoG [Planctomycetaceae bacterium]|tara:strand:- start:12002 stop:13384 length:1383 start_codon:yes stop_codon:yes gene_type:complete